MPKKQSRCWPGYTPVPGKKAHEQGSCRPKAKSRLTEGESEFRAERRRQLDRWKKDHPGSPTKAAQHLHAPAKKSKSRTTATHKRAASQRRSSTRRGTATRRS